MKNLIHLIVLILVFGFSAHAQVELNGFELGSNYYGDGYKTDADDLNYYEKSTFSDIDGVIGISITNDRTIWRLSFVPTIKYESISISQKQFEKFKKKVEKHYKVKFSMRKLANPPNSYRWKASSLLTTYEIIKKPSPDNPGYIVTFRITDNMLQALIED